tara:strand:- start:444 stop:893 length:450 start_codon:yes stop_codon:yes gene_type:complete
MIRTETTIFAALVCDLNTRWATRGRELGASSTCCQRSTTFTGRGATAQDATDDLRAKIEASQWSKINEFPTVAFTGSVVCPGCARIRDENAPRFAPEPLPICRYCADSSHCGFGHTDPDYRVLDAAEAQLCEAADCDLKTPTTNEETGA